VPHGPRAHVNGGTAAAARPQALQRFRRGRPSSGARGKHAGKIWNIRESLELHTARSLSSRLDTVEAVAAPGTLHRINRTHISDGAVPAERIPSAHILWLSTAGRRPATQTEPLPRRRVKSSLCSRARGLPRRLPRKLRARMVADPSPPPVQHGHKCAVLKDRPGTQASSSGRSTRCAGWLPCAALARSECREWNCVLPPANARKIMGSLRAGGCPVVGAHLRGSAASRRPREASASFQKDGSVHAALGQSCSAVT
jgi:hypothetical protein